MSTDVVQPDSRLLVHFILLLADGSVAESTRASGKPALFRLGDGSLSPALEAELLGLAAGAKHQFTLRSDQAYGESNPDLIQYFPKRDFMQSGEPKVGAIILFSAMDGSELPGIIRQISGDSVTVDFNHPLAGQDITFQLEVLEINPAAEEINANFTG